MIVVTGAAGFIGSALVHHLLRSGYSKVIAVDDFSRDDKNRNLEAEGKIERVDRMKFENWIEANKKSVNFIFHLGARTDTTEFDQSIFDELNLNYSKMVWRKCATNGIPLVYASSAATYGGGEMGYDDRHDIITSLKPLNPYGHSKNDFDIWALQQENRPLFWAGLKFFNVYGPNEYHKGRMASVVFHAFNQIKATGKMKLFRSHNPKFKNGEQLRDFIYIKDVVSVCMFLMNHNQPENSGLYNLGTGKARTFIDLTRSTFHAMGIKEDIGFIDTPIDIRDKYQYFTEANMSKLRTVGYKNEFISLENGVEDYVTNYLISGKYF